MEMNLMESNNNHELNVEDIKKYIAPNATEKELYMFLNICKSYQLNPFKKEIHFIKYGNVQASIIVGYETYLKRAEDSGKLDGWEVNSTPDGAEIIIYRSDRKYPVRWRVLMKEFNKGQSSWKTMPDFMIKKVALAQGFRLAFPKELAGMPYTQEEMTTIDVKPEQTTVTPEQKQKSFEELLKQTNQEYIERYIIHIMNGKYTRQQIITRAENNWSQFVSAYLKWVDEIKKAELNKPIEVDNLVVEEFKEVSMADKFKEQQQQKETKECPERDNSKVYIEFCNNTCTKKDGCPAWE